MKIVTLDASLRDERGKGPARRLRFAGTVPAVIYGGETPVSIRISSRDLETILRHVEGTSLLVEIRLSNGESRSIRTLLKEVQRDPVQSHLLHADFQEIREGQQLHLTTPVHLAGMPPGVKEQGGVVDHILRELDVACIAEAIPDFVEVDISGLFIGDSIHVREITVPEGVTIRNAEDAVIVNVIGRTVEEEKPEEAEEVAEEAAAEEGEAAEGKEESSKDSKDSKDSKERS
jgi:large subunit ribosomal protein L25